MPTKRFARILGALFLLAAACPTRPVSAADPALPENLLRNGGFEEIEDGRPTHWSFEEKQQTTLDAGAIRVDIVEGSGGNYGQIQQTIPVRPNTRYRVEARLKGTAPRIAFIQVKKRKGREEIERIPTEWNATDWTPVRETFNSGLADNVLVICRYRQAADHVGETVWFDDVALREADGLPKEGVHEPEAVTTFESIGLYWKPADGAPDNTCHVRFREAGAESWREALPLWFDPNQHKDLPQHSEEYRGSIVHLNPATRYEIELRLEKTGETRRLLATTWSENFPVKEVRKLDAPGEITEGGSEAEGYVVYQADDVLDAGDSADCVLKVKAPWVILRGLTLRGGRKHGVVLESHHIVVEDCDISGYGETLSDGWGENLNSAVYSNSSDAEFIVIQRCRLHDPRSDANSWREEPRTIHGDPSTHPIGPQGICLAKGRGRYVIRFNRITSDMDHMFNDGMGETRNGSFAGFPNRDSDIHDNFASNCWDDGFEIEGANMNVRVWRNATDICAMSIAGATTSLGPAYFWRNVSLRSRWGPTDSASDQRGGGLFKLGQRWSEHNGGRMYMFHNSALQPPPWPGSSEPSGVRAGLRITGDDYEQRNMVSRNNVLHCSIPRSSAVNDPSKHPTNTFDYDLYYGEIRAADGMEKHGLFAEPRYEQGPDGRPWLLPGSPGHDAGERIPNFNDDFKGEAPDMGAFERGDDAPLPPTWPKLPTR